MDLKYVLDYTKHIRQMEKKQMGSQARVGFIKGLIDKKTEDIIAQRGGEVTFARRLIIKNQVEADLRKSISRVGLTVAALSLAVGIGAKVNNVLTGGTYTGIEVTKEGVNLDQSEVGDITIQLDENSAENTITLAGNGFDEDLRVELKEVQELMQQDKALRQNIENDVDMLTTQDEVLTYVKEMYLEKYNQENATSYTIEDIRVEKSRYGIEFDEKAQAENGDSIVRLKKARDQYEHDNMGLVKVFIAGMVVEKGAVMKSDNQYRNVYLENETVLAEKPTNPLGKILSTGIDYAVALNNESKNSEKVMQTYKNQFIDAIEEYKENQIEEIKAGKNNEIAQNKDELEER